MEDLLKEYSDVRESDLENENEMKIPEKSERSDTYSKPKIQLPMLYQVH
jgi:hypothetical protein